MDKSKLKRYLLIAAILAGAALIVLLILFLAPRFASLNDPDVQAILQEKIGEAGWGGWLFLLIIEIVQIVVAPIPGGPVEILAGLLVGVWSGLLLCLVGLFISTWCIFALVRRFGVGLVEKVAGRDVLREYKFLNQSGPRLYLVVFVIFFIPYMPKDLLTYLAALTPINMWLFMLISFVARIPFLFANLFVGDSASEGNWGMAGLIFILTVLIAALGVRYKDKILARLREGDKTSEQGAAKIAAETGAEAGPLSETASELSAEDQTPGSPFNPS